MKMIGAPHGLQDGLIQPLAKYYPLTFSPLLIQLRTSYSGICSEVQHWGEAQCDAQYLYPLACQVDQRYHGTFVLIYSI